jgi:hypothetical protein
MEELLILAVKQSPTIIGFVALSAVLYRQNEKLLSALIERIELLERQVVDLKVMLANAAGRDSVK